MSALDPSPQYVKSNGEIYKVFQKKTKASIEAGDCEHELEDLEGKKAVIAFIGSELTDFPTPQYAALDFADNRFSQRNADWCVGPSKLERAFARLL